MLMTGIIGASTYMSRFIKRVDFCEIDRDVASLIADGYASWDSTTEKVHATEMGMRRKTAKSRHGVTQVGILR